MTPVSALIVGCGGVILFTGARVPVYSIAMDFLRACCRIEHTHGAFVRTFTTAGGRNMKYYSKQDEGILQAGTRGERETEHHPGVDAGMQHRKRC